MVRRFEVTDAKAVSELIAKTLRTTNINDYTSEYIEDIILKKQPEDIIECANETHFYVVCEDDTIVGCGGIGSYMGKDDECHLLMIFVLPEYQGKGIGRKIIETLEHDEIFLKAKKIEISASITACRFYEKLGYRYKNGIAAIDDEQLFRMEKFR